LNGDVSAQRWVHVDIHASSDTLTLGVSTNENPREGDAIEIIRERLSALYGTAAKLTSAITASRETASILDLPLAARGP